MPASRSIGFDRVKGYEVSTIRMLGPLAGMDPSLVFDSWVYGEDVSWNRFYASRAEAKGGHAELVARIRSGDIDPDWRR